VFLTLYLSITIEYEVLIAGLDSSHREIIVEICIVSSETWCSPNATIPATLGNVKGSHIFLCVVQETKECALPVKSIRKQILPDVR